MLQDIDDILQFRVDGADGPIGRVKDLYFDDRTWTVRFLVVETDASLGSRDVLVSPMSVGTADPGARMLQVSLTREQARNSPDVDSRKPVSRQHEVEQLAYYGYPYYWGGSGLWGDGMQPRKMLAAYGGTVEAPGREAQFVERQAQQRLDRGDDPDLRSARALIRYHVHATDGELGHVDGLLVDDETWSIRYVVVNTSDWWLGHKVLAAPSWISDISWLEATVSIDLSRDALKHAPAYDPDALPDRGHEQLLHDHVARRGDWTAGE